jgi:hypothetical protein
VSFSVVRRHDLLAGLLVVLAVALVGCGGSGGTKTTVSTVSPAAGPPFQAKSALITLADLPSGWAVKPSTDSSTSNDKFCGKKNETLKSLVGVKAVGKAEADFAQSGSIPLLVHLVAAFPPGQAATAFAAIRQLFADCTSLKAETGQTLDIAAVSFASLGDESLPLLISGNIQGFPVGFYFVAVRVKMA